MAQIPESLALLDVVNHAEINLCEATGNKGLVLIFSSINCPFDRSYHGRLTNLVNVYRKKGIEFIYINSQRDKRESLEEMKDYVLQNEIQVPYLADKDKFLMEVLGASKTPECFLFKRKGGKLELFYHGAIDNNPQVAADVKDVYLKENLEKMLLEKPASPTETKPAGCRIK